MPIYTIDKWDSSDTGSVNVTGFWKITHMGAPETIRIFDFSMALLIVQTIFKNISKLYL